MLEEKPHTEALRKRAPVLWRSQMRYHEFLDMDEQGVLYCDLSFSQQLRIRRRYHTEVHGPEYGLPWEGGTRLKSAGMSRVAPVLPSIPASKLTFDCLKAVNNDELTSDLSGFEDDDDE
jgi:hypothetical protein